MYDKDCQLIADAVAELRRWENPNVSAYARDHGLNYQRLLRAYKGGNNRSTRPSTNRKLTEEQDLALERFLDAVDDIGFGIHAGLVAQQANALLAESHTGSDPPPTVGKRWPARWLKAHPKFVRVKAKPLEIARKLAQSPEGIQAWFMKVQAKIEELGVLPEDMWNMDECGVRVGVSKSQYVYTKHGKQILIPHANNREQISLVECCSADGRVIDPMLIIKASTIFEHWIVDLPPKYLIHTSDSGYSNDQTSLDWIKHFDRMTENQTKGVWRLLFLDGYGSHYTKEFCEYAESKKIQLIGLPPHTTHLLQPLDVGCFQPLKWYHGRTLDYASRTGARDINKTDFLAVIDEVRRETFKKGTIKSGWRRTGLYPFNPGRIVDELKPQEIVNAPQEAATVRLAVPRPATPTFNSSDVENEEGEPVLSTPQMSSRRLREHLHEVQNPTDAYTYILKPGDFGWRTPKSIREIELQSEQVKITLMQCLPNPIATDILRTLKGSSIIAKTAEGLQRQLNSTKAAELARAERRRRKRRALDTGGGPIYSEDARGMVKKRKEDEIAKQERLLRHRKEREVTILLNKWKKLRSNLRNWGKKSLKRQLEGVTVWRDVRRWVYSADDEGEELALQALREANLEYMSNRGAFRPCFGIQHDLTTAAEAGVLARGAFDPYTKVVCEKPSDPKSEVQYLEDSEASSVDASFVDAYSHTSSKRGGGALTDDDDDDSSDDETIDQVQADWGCF
jgi:hypothetical protein